MVLLFLNLFYNNHIIINTRLSYLWLPCDLFYFIVMDADKNHFFPHHLISSFSCKLNCIIYYYYYYYCNYLLYTKFAINYWKKTYYNFCNFYCCFLTKMYHYFCYFIVIMINLNFCMKVAVMPRH